MENILWAATSSHFACSGGISAGRLKLPLGLSYVKQVYRLVYAFRCYRHDSDPICIGFSGYSSTICNQNTTHFLLCIRKEILALYLICLSLPGEVYRSQCIWNLTFQFIWMFYTSYFNASTFSSIHISQQSPEIYSFSYSHPIFNHLFWKRCYEKIQTSCFKQSCAFFTADDCTLLNFLRWWIMSCSSVLLHTILLIVPVICNNTAI